MLRDKLALWATREEKVPLYKKMDIRDYIFILDKIKQYKLEEVVEWRLMRLPFDTNPIEGKKTGAAWNSTANAVNMPPTLTNRMTSIFFN